ncbi:hypothetical protein VTO42DRAFT_2434 [Malbranchea cinnamomea]
MGNGEVTINNRSKTKGEQELESSPRKDKLGLGISLALKNQAIGCRGARAARLEQITAEYAFPPDWSWTALRFIGQSSHIIIIIIIIIIMRHRFSGFVSRSATKQVAVWPSQERRMTSASDPEKVLPRAGLDPNRFCASEDLNSHDLRLGTGRIGRQPSRDV